MPASDPRPVADGDFLRLVAEAQAARQGAQLAEQRLQLAVELAGMRLYDLDLVGGALAHFGAAETLLESEPTFDELWPDAHGLIHAEDRERVRSLWEDSVAAGTPMRTEFRVPRSDGEVRWCHCTAELFFDDAGTPQRLIAATVDITERKRGEIALLQTMAQMREHEARQKLLLDELNHRVKNTLASVQSVAVQTLRDTHDLADARGLFIERLMALSSTHSLLVRRAWDSAALRDLADVMLRPYGHTYAMTGPDLSLDPNFAVSVGMALHELATNAVKHGAWRDGGRVQIDVQAEAGDEAQITWRESGGPPVGPPSRSGFGSRLLQRGVAAELGGQVSLDFAPEGLVCVIRAPLSERLRLAPAAAG
jgi:two-component sensor histidine kinase